MRNPHPGAGTRGGLRPRRLSRGLAVLFALSLVATGAACASGTGSDKVTLTVGLFGDFGFKPLYAEYTKTHPNITIKERVAEYADHHKNLAAHLATNTGAADVEAIELGYISQFTAQPKRFANLLDYGAGAAEK